MFTYVTHAVKMRLFWSVHMVKIDFLVYILPFTMVVKILKSDNPKQSYPYLTFGVLKSMKWRNWLSKFGVYHWVNCQLGPKSSKLHNLSFKFWSKTFILHFKHINDYDIAKISKSQKVTLTHIFSRFSIFGVWCCTQKHLSLIEWITYDLATWYNINWKKKYIAAVMKAPKNTHFFVFKMAAVDSYRPYS